jgi:endonuclease/exonuclease/phosphatase family metal-dependent hydrolase
LLALILLFWLQALRALFSTTFGILYDQIFAGSPTAWLPISLSLVVLSMAAPFVADGAWVRRAPAVPAVVAALARIPLTLNNADVRFAASLIVVAAAGVALAGELRQNARRAWVAGVLALLADALLRIAGATFDLSLLPMFLPVQILLSLAVAAAAVASPSPAEGAPAGGGRPLGSPLAFGAVVFLETSLLSAANATARWGGVAYELMAPVLLVATMFPLIPSVERAAAAPAGRLVLLVAIPAGLMLGTAAPGPLAGIGLFVAQASTILAFRAWVDPYHRVRKAGAAVAWGMSFFLLLSFLNAFTFTYPYTIPLLRGLGWAVYLAAALAAGLSLLRHADRPPTGRVTLGPAAAGLLTLALAVLLVWPQAPDDRLDARALRLATYNIHYGYDEEWRFNLESLAETLRTEGVDAVALQEVDTGRMTSYMADDAYFLARRLGMRVAYLPTVEHLTGIAVLYRGASPEIERRFLTSLQEQTGIVHVQLDVEGRPLHMFGLWMGLSDEDTRRQIDEALDFVGDRSPAALGGDFNAQPGTPVVEAVQAAGLIDPFDALGIRPAPPTSPAVRPVERIDYVFLRGVSVRQAEVSGSLASDHRMVVVEVDLTLPPLPGLAAR